MAHSASSLAPRLALLSAGILIFILLAEFGLRMIPQFPLPKTRRHFLKQVLMEKMREHPSGIAFGRPSVRLLALGDSFTYGAGVGDDETYPYLLESHLEKKCSKSAQVFNAGSPGTTIFEQLPRYLKLKETVPHETVIFLFAKGNMSAARSNKLHQFLENHLWDFLDQDLQRIRFYRFLRFHISNAIDFYFHSHLIKNSKKTNDDYIRPLTELLESIEGRNRQVLVVYQDLKTLSAIEALCRARGWPIIKALKKGSYFRLPDGHLNAEGNSLLAKEIFEALIKNGLADCPGRSNVNDHGR